MTTFTRTIVVPTTGYFLDEWAVRTQERRKSDNKILASSSVTPSSTGDFTLSSPDIYDRFIKLIPEQPLGTDWQASTAYSLSDYVHPTTFAGYVFRCTTAGTSGGTEPTWDQTHGNTTSDNTVTWTAVTYLGEAAGEGKFWEGEYEAAAGDAATLDPAHANTAFYWPNTEAGAPTRTLNMTDVDFTDGVADFNGSTSFIEIESAPTLTNFTFAFKFTADSASGTGGTTRIFGWKESGGTFSWDGASAAGQFLFQVYDGSAYQSAQLTSTPGAGTEHAVIATYDGTTLKLYFNKTMEDSATFSRTIGDEVTNSMLGCYVFGTGTGDDIQHWAGTISKFIAADRAWTQAEIDAFVDYG